MAETKLNYIGVAEDYRDDKVIVWGRDESGRVATRFTTPRYFYIPDVNGEFTSMYGEQLSKLSFDDMSEFKAAKQHHPVKFESDIGSIERVLMDNYYGLDVPQMHYGFFDIESEILRGRGFSPPSNPFAPVNAITFYRAWDNKFVTIAVPPESQQHLVGQTFDIDLAQYEYDNEDVELILVSCESELLYLLLDHLQEFDFISGWHSEFYDLPYIYKRIEAVLGETALRQLCFPGAGKPKTRDVERYGKDELTIELKGRTHVDYMAMFKKFTFEGRESYTLNAIAEEEVGAKKLHYEGSLMDLYYDDFVKFVHYNIIDVVLIKKLDEKFKFVQLINQMAHENTVPFEAILGTTKYVDMGITNYAHHKLNVIVKDKHVSTHGKVEGAIVMTPNVGLHEWIGSVDINSLYPSVIRSLNLSPEKLIGQFDTDDTQLRIFQNAELKPIIEKADSKGGDVVSFIRSTGRERDWQGIMSGDDFIHTAELVNGEKVSKTGKEWKQLFKENKWAVSAFGTILDQSCGAGIVPQTLAFWYDERKRLQAEKKKWSKKVKELKEAGNKGPAYIHARYQEDHYDLLQLTKKIQLNSAYGALLASGFRWGAENIGASVTYCGRAITTHMLSTIGHLLTGEQVNLIKSYEAEADGRIANRYTASHPCIIYGDTDSGYFLTGASNKEDAVAIADEIAELVNASFIPFMQEAFNCQPEFDNIIAAGREVVAIRGLFQARKKYMLRVVDLEGFAVDKMKAMGSEIKKSDTPKVIQKFLKSTVDLILDGKEYNDLVKFVNDERARLFSSEIDVEDILLFGTTKSANNLDHFTEAYFAELDGKPFKNASGSGKLTIPGHVRAAINFNVLSKEFEGADGKQITGGDKVKVFQLKPNDFDFPTIAVPAETDSFPSWLTDNLLIDLKQTEEKLVENKLKGIFAAWGYEVPSPLRSRIASVLSF